MNPQDLIPLVREMRAAQRTYFRTRDQYALRTSKRLEKEVDDWLAQWDGKDAPKQGALI